MVLHSVDYVQTEQGVDDNELQAPNEYLNSINASGLPLSKLELKIGCPVMLRSRIFRRWVEKTQGWNACLQLHNTL
jgi:hypothetical protein